MISHSCRKILAAVLASAVLLPFAGCDKKAPVFDMEKGYIEAEDCLVKHSNTLNAFGFSGEKAVDLSESDSSLSFNYNITSTSHYELDIDYGFSAGGTVSMFVNGAFYKKITFPGNGSHVTEIVTLKEGAGEISFKLQTGDSAVVLDKFSLRKSEHTVSLVVAPHEDDEILAFAGSIQKAKAAGDDVKVVLLTNGDYFGGDLGPIRMRESINALAQVGVEDTDVYFLGYGDLILKSIYDSSDPNIVFTAPSGFDTTFADPSSNVYDYHTLCTGSGAKYSYANFKVDLYNLIDTLRPDKIYTTSEAEWHPDHCYAFKIVRDIVESLNSEKNYHTTICSSVIHGEDLEWPGRLDTDASGNPEIVEFTNPFPSGGVDLDWGKVTKITLTDEEVLAKKRAIDEYDTQNYGRENFPGNSTFNYAFCRRDEFYWIYEY